jgi:hypothetical protein
LQFTKHSEVFAQQKSIGIHKKLSKKLSENLGKILRMVPPCLTFLLRQILATRDKNDT